MKKPQDNTRCGFVAVIGLPNAGKSTLVNHLVGSKVSIVSRKTHTTRTRILGIALHKKAQIILIDTPGIFDAKGARAMERAMISKAFDALDESDSVIHLIDASTQKALKKSKTLIEKMPANKPVFLVLNKTDKTHKPDLLKLAAEFNERFNYAATFMISALKGSGTDEVLETLCNTLEPGPWMFNQDQITDMPMRMMAAEITREKIYEQLHQELPYAAMVETEAWEVFDNGSIKISQLIFVERNTQKAIILGKGGKQIKQIGEEARKEMEKLFENTIHLKLLVKVQENWAEKSENLRLLGLLE